MTDALDPFIIGDVEKVLEERTETMWGLDVTVVSVLAFSDDAEASECLIGTELANILQVETFNLYASLRRNGHSFFKATYQVVRQLDRAGFGFARSATSVTFVPITEKLVDFVSDRLEEQMQRKRKRIGGPMMLEGECQDALEDSAENSAIATIESFIQTKKWLHAKH